MYNLHKCYNPLSTILRHIFRLFPKPPQPSRATSQSAVTHTTSFKLSSDIHTSFNTLLLISSLAFSLSPAATLLAAFDPTCRSARLTLSSFIGILS